MNGTDDGLRGLLARPIPLGPNRVHRFYEGGEYIDRLRGVPGPRDGDHPEDWVGSVTSASARRGFEGEEGLSRIALPGGGETTLRALVEAFPEPSLGAAHVAKYGPSTGLLVKLLDSRIRLPIHCHPTRPFAQRHFSDIFGKTEAWMVLDTRPSVAEPYLLLGFQEGVDKASFRRQVERQEVVDMRAGLHRLPVRPGDVIYVKAGLPHAIGEGVFMIEAQEPTDYSVVAEWDGFPIDPESAHLGLGWDVALECFDFTGMSAERVANEYRVPPQVLRSGSAGQEVQLLGGRTAEYFGATRLSAQGEMPIEESGFYIGIVTAGRGVLEGEWGEIPLRRGDTFACTAAVVPHAYRGVGGEILEVVRCLPPT